MFFRSYQRLSINRDYIEAFMVNASNGGLHGPRSTFLRSEYRVSDQLSFRTKEAKSLQNIMYNFKWEREVQSKFPYDTWYLTWPNMERTHLPQIACVCAWGEQYCHLLSPICPFCILLAELFDLFTRKRFVRENISIYHQCAPLPTQLPLRERILYILYLLSYLSGDCV